MTHKELPRSGYVIEKIYSPHQSLTAVEPNEITSGGMDFGWDWRLLDNAPERFEVQITLNVHPSSHRPEKLSGTVIGTFKSVTDQPSVGLENFVRFHAPAILLPYVRQVLSGLTNLSYFGTFYLPAINIAKLMGDFDTMNAVGAKQLAKRGTGATTSRDPKQLAAPSSLKKVSRKKRS